MVNEYQINITGLGTFVINADVIRVKSKKSKSNLECEVEIIDVKKFSEDDETYLPYDASDQEIILFQKEVAVNFFKQLH